MPSMSVIMFMNSNQFLLEHTSDVCCLNIKCNITCFYRSVVFAFKLAILCNAYSVPPIEQQVVAVSYNLEDMVYPAVYAQQFIMDIVDGIIEQKHGRYTDEQNEANEDYDRLEHYQQLRDQVRVIIM